MNIEEQLKRSLSGRVFQINVSEGGVPKKSVDRCLVSVDGILEDSQMNKKLHGGRDRALCLYSLDLILKLVNEGHPIYSGALGENITFSGFKWDFLHPGTRLKIGKDIALQVTQFTSPCQSISDFFIDGRYDRISQKSNPGWSRVYAKVLQSGTIKIGDPVILESY